jgi:hypothetical protein
MLPMTSRALQQRQPVKRRAIGISASARLPIVHELKSWPQFFEPIVAGRKTHELRRSDERDYQVGDRLRLREFDPASNTYTGRVEVVAITYITSADQPCALSEMALGQGFCILSICKLAAAPFI